MNRLTVILLALGILLAHTLAIHQTVEGAFASPYDIAHVAYRVARNLVRAGSAAWNPGEGPFDAYPSLTWVGICAVFERLHVAPTFFSQAVGIGCALVTVIVLAQFSSNRMGGLIAPLFLALSGSVAAAGASGTEAPLAMLLVSVAFLAFEWRWKLVLGVVTSLLVLTRPEGIAFVGALLALELFDRPRATHSGTSRRIGSAFLAPCFVFAVACLGRWSMTGRWLAPFERDLLDLSLWRATLGWHYVSSYFLCSGVGVLVPLPLLLLVTGKISAIGRRALVLFLVWCGVVALSGGDGLPFWNGLAAALPLYFLAIQEAITGLLDRRPRFAPVAWSVLVLAGVASLFVSKTPSDVGPFRIRDWHRAWLEPPLALADAYGCVLGRPGLNDEIKRVERLRTLGVFLRDHIDEPATVVTLWPGAIGYLSRRHVFDMLGRATPSEDYGAPRSWRGPTKIDLVRAFEGDGDYVVPIVGTLREGATPADFLHEWLMRYDVEGDNDERILELLAALWGFELTAVPVPLHSRDLSVPSPTPFLILRNKELRDEPRVQLEYDDGSFTVLIHHHAHQQIVDLTVKVTDRQGHAWRMRPTGDFVAERVVAARTDLLLYPTGSRPIVALHGVVPDALRHGELSVQLHNPSTSSDIPLAAVGEAARVRLDRE